MSWAGLIPTMVVALAILAVPGFLVARICRIRVPYSLAFAPVLGSAVIGLLTLITGPLHVRWGWGPVAALMGVLVVAWIVVEIWVWLRARRDRLEPSSFISKQSIVQTTYIALGVLAFAGIQFFSLAAAMGTPDALPHLGDADFHLQGTLLVHQTGNAFPIGALDDLYTPDEISNTYYPTLWHAWTALLLGPVDLIVATNAAALVLALVIWPLGVAALGLALRPQSPSMGLLAPLVAAPIATFPGIVEMQYSIYPFSLAMAALPVSVAALVLWMRYRKWNYGAVYAVAVLAAVLAQPSVAIFGLVAGGFALVTAIVCWWWAKWESGRRVLPTVALFALAVIGAITLYALRDNPRIVALGQYARPQMEERPLRALIDGSVATGASPWGPWFLVGLFAVIGILVLGRTAYGWMYSLLTITASVAYVAAAGPDSLLRALTGPWYKDHFRLAGIASMLIAVVAAVGVAWLIDREVSARVKTRYGLLLAVVTTVLVPVGWKLWDPEIAQAERSEVATGYLMEDPSPTPMTIESVGLMERLDEHFAPGERLLSAHHAGGGFIVAYSDMKPYVPLRVMITPEQKKIAADLNDIETDPEICEILNEHNVRAFMADLDSPYRGAWGPLAGPPELDVTEGFELVDEQGSVKVWRITACD